MCLAIVACKLIMAGLPPCESYQTSNDTVAGVKAYAIQCGHTDNILRSKKALREALLRYSYAVVIPGNTSKPLCTLTTSQTCI